jgi:uncharacterized membrane protein YeaQ/YmgE (transglycosylase-associated protein family)
MIVNIIAWIVLGAIAGWIAGMLVKGDERWGVIGHVVLGIIGAIVGGFIAQAIFPTSGAGASAANGDINIGSIIVAVIGAVIVVWVVNFLVGSRRTVR